MSERLEELKKDFENLKKEYDYSDEDIKKIPNNIGICEYMDFELSLSKVRLEERERAERDFREELDKVLVWADDERKSNNIYRRSVDYLNEDWIERIEKIKEVFE